MQAIEQEEVVDSAPASLCKEDASSEDSMRVKFEAAVRRAQDDICKAVSELDGKPFHEDAWTRPGGGGGVSRVLQVRLDDLPCTSFVLDTMSVLFQVIAAQ